MNNSAVAMAGPGLGVQTTVTRTIDEFADLLRNSVMPLAVKSRHSSAFVGRMRAAGRGRVFCYEVTAPEHTIERTPELIKESAVGEYYKVSLMLQGESMVMQDSREAVLRQGDIAIYDTTRPYSLLSSEGARTAIVMFPREMIALPPELVGQLTAVRFDRSQGLAASVSPFMTQLMMQLDQFARPGGSRLPHNIVDLLGTMLVSELDLAPTETSHGSQLLRQIMSYIEDNLSVPDLRPGTIAAAHFISPRYLQMLFQRNGVTVSSWIRERRLERCHRDLADPSHASDSVTALAARWGFLEPAHFSRTYKKRFGVSPRETRVAVSERMAA
ncbi:helix-turn-helix domain-containing protein [Arthrobacter crystallopoietes]|uniref:AraC-type DNA-binding protein n=1 Tax=Crystallibacter crystallopoietes TaxID=37928 RepID=A0A1H1BXH5_9MICC|nr:helix-turn-helix domain-containing protein [Arthrobacter crystallopoietes]SDQ56623.1 AraC-type DNA-binding protein [Arthrobacter crystallopoietes]